MELAADVPMSTYMAVISVAARGNTSVSAVVSRAVVEYILDVDSGLLAPPQPVLRSLLGRKKRVQV